MKIKFLAKPAGTDYERGQVVEFDDKDWVQMSYPQKYLREGIAEEVIEPAEPPVAGSEGKLHAPTCTIIIDGTCNCDGWPPDLAPTTVKKKK